MEYFICSANAIDFVPVCISTNRMEHEKTEIITLNLKMSVFVKTLAQLSNSHHNKSLVSSSGRSDEGLTLETSAF